MRGNRRQRKIDELRLGGLRDLFPEGVHVDPVRGGPDFPPRWQLPPIVVTRPTDLLRLRFGFVGLRLDRGVDGLVLRPDQDGGAGRIVVDHAPQHLVEESGTESAGSVAWPHRPVAVRLSGHSRVVVQLAADDAVPWSLAGLLDALARLPMALVGTALPAPSRGRIEVDPDLHLRVPIEEGLVVTPANAPVLARIATTWRRGVRAALALGEVAEAGVVRTALGGMGVDGIDGVLLPPVDLTEGLTHPAPEQPGPQQTSLELPWRLQLSPLDEGTWVHPQQPAEHDGRVALWASRLATRASGRTGAVAREGGSVRAVWTRDFDGWPGSSSSTAAVPEDASADVPGFLTSLSARQRMFLVHETSNFSLRSDRRRWVPPPVEVEHLALSTLGGWLTSRFSTRSLPDGPAGILGWDHLATMGRDHHVQVEELGFLYPFGHRASLTTITERKFATDQPGTPAYLVQRSFVTVLERTRTFSSDRVHLDDRVDPARRCRLDLVMPFASVTLLDTATPLLDPRTSDGGGGSVTGQAFFPTVAGTSFGFRILAVDRLGHRVEYAGPLMFVGKGANTDHAQVATVVAAYRARNSSAQAVHRLSGQQLAFAPDSWEGEPLDTTLAVDELRWDAANLETAGAPSPGAVRDDVAAFAPMLDSASVVVPSVAALSGRSEPISVRYPDHYAAQGLVDNAARVFLGVEATPPVSFRDQADRSGGFVTPDLAVTGLSGLTGPIGGDLDKAVAGTTDAADFFAAADGAKLFGIVSLADLVGELPPAAFPRFVADQLDRVSALQHDLARLVALVDQVQQRVDGLPAEAQAQVAAVQAQLQAVADQAAATLAALLDLQDGAAFEAAAGTLAGSLGTLATDLEAATVLPRPVRVDAAGVVRRVGEQVADLDELVALVKAVAGGLALPEAVTARLHWSAGLRPWPSPGNAVFRPRTLPGDPPDAVLDLAVELAAPVKAGGPPTATATCSISPFALRLVGSDPFITLNIDTIEFAVTAGRKPDVNVVFAHGDELDETRQAVVFGGPLTWVNELRRWIPPDGFSDPPYLDVSTAGITAGFDLGLPDLPLGILNLSQLSLGAEVNVPFVGESLDFRFSFCTRERPFHLTVWVFGGGGFFAITLTPEKCLVLEAAFEFGACTSLDFGVASGSVEVMAGIYLRLQEGNSLLAGYFRLRGEVDVLGLVSASLELYLEIGYEPETKTARGRAQLTIEVEVLFFSTSVTLEVEKKFKGSDQDPSFATVMGPRSDDQPLADSPWAHYCAAFAAV